MNVNTVELYRQMLRIRMVEEAIAEEYPQQQMRCPVHLCIGQEAIAAGMCASLGAEDYVFSAHRSHGHYLARGGSLRAMLAELYGKATGCSHGKGGSMHLIDLDAGFMAATPIVGSTIPIAVGAAMGAQMRGESRVVVVFLGDGATEEGVFHESVNWAVLRKVPCVFVCENNLYSVYSPLSVRQPHGRSIAEFVKAYGLPSEQADGNDVLEVARLGDAAVARARAGEGPSFLEFMTYRWREHCGPNFDDDVPYRPTGELLRWQNTDPIRRLHEDIIDNRIASVQSLESIAREIETEIADGLAFAKESAFPDAEEAFMDVYCEAGK